MENFDQLISILSVQNFDHFTAVYIKIINQTTDMLAFCSGEIFGFTSKSFSGINSKYKLMVSMYST